MCIIVTDLCTFVCVSRMASPISISLVRARQLLDTEVCAQILSGGAVWVCQVLCVDTEAVGGVADAVALSVLLV